MVERKTGSGLLRWLQIRNWTVVIYFIGFNIIVDEEVDQLLGIMGTSCVKTGANLIVGSTLVRGAKLGSSVIHFLRGSFVFFIQWRQWITKMKNQE
jgi:hypothetical protein